MSSLKVKLVRQENEQIKKLMIEFVSSLNTKRVKLLNELVGLLQ